MISQQLDSLKRKLDSLKGKLDQRIKLHLKNQVLFQRINLYFK